MRLVLDGRLLVQGRDYVVDAPRGMGTLLRLPPGLGHRLRIDAEYQPAHTAARIRPLQACAGRGKGRGGRWWDRRARGG